METELGIVVSARDWAERLHRFLVDHGGARVRTRVLRPEDAIAEDYDVLVIDDVTLFLNRRLVQQVQAQGRSVVGVWDASNNPAGEAFLTSLGVDASIDANASADEFVRVVSAFGTAQRVAKVVEAGPDLAAGASRRGQLVVVGASSGGAGATEISVGLASSMSKVASRSLLLDGDDVVPAVAQRLGLPLHPNLRTSVDALLHQPERLGGTFHSSRRLPFDVVAGISNPQDWIELRPGDVVGLVNDEIHRRDFVVANVSARIEDLAYHGGAPRYALGRALLGAADQLVVVSAPTPVGVARTLEWVAQVRLLAPHRPIHLIFNRAPKSMFKMGELTLEITRTYTPISITPIADDRRVYEAVWRGEPVGSGSFSKGIEAVAAALSAVTAGRVAS